jgi:hypothetical protein
MKLTNVNRSASQQLPRLLMGPECSLPCSQKPAIGPYSEPDEPNPNYFILPHQDPF